MTLHINEAEVRQILTMPMALAAVEEISRKQATGEVVVHPRKRFELPSGGGFFHYMAAMDTAAACCGNVSGNFQTAMMTALTKTENTAY